ncbi:MAG TPA: hypothetical protein VKR83_21140 [Ktedonobacteraceae bacterium]|nr:hypothetical protein [Ktedonobacteraceae bacterium]
MAIVRAGGHGERPRGDMASDREGTWQGQWGMASARGHGEREGTWQGQ